MRGVHLEIASLRAGAGTWLADHSALRKEWIASITANHRLLVKRGTEDPDDDIIRMQL